jgi:hypothetical protein
MTKFRAFILCLALPVIFTLAFSQATKERVSQDSSMPLKLKRESEELSKQRLNQLMSAAGVRVEESPVIIPDASYRMIRIRLGASTSAVTTEAQPTPAATIIQDQKRNGTLPRQRSRELSPEQLLVVTVDEKSQLRWYALIPDPRILRAEAPGPDNVMTGQTLYLESADFVVNVPDDARARELRFYKPSWTGTEFTLNLISAVQLPNN